VITPAATPTTIESTEYACRRGLLRPGTRFTVAGGPYYIRQDGVRTAMRDKGPFRFRRYCRSENRQWIEAFSREGFCVLNVGPAYESRVVPGLVNRPYRITKVFGGSEMKAKDVKVGSVYTAKVTDKVVPVRIETANRSGGWNGTNLVTGKKVQIKSAARLRGEYQQAKTSPDAPSAASRTTSQAAQGGQATKQDAKPGKPATQDAPKTPTVGTGAKEPPKATKEANPKPVATGAKRGDQAAKKTGTKKAAGKMSGLDAAARVLAEAGKPMGVKQIVETALAKGYWKSNGRTPAATIYSAILREIATKKNKSRFKKTRPGKFAING